MNMSGFPAMKKLLWRLNVKIILGNHHIEGMEILALRCQSAFPNFSDKFPRV